MNLESFLAAFDVGHLHAMGARALGSHRDS
jgi:hypothetical protein